MNENNKIYVVGHKGMVSSAIVRQLKKKGCKNILRRNFSDLDLSNQVPVLQGCDVVVQIDARFFRPVEAGTPSKAKNRLGLAARVTMQEVYSGNLKVAQRHILLKERRDVYSSLSGVVA